MYLNRREDLYRIFMAGVHHVDPHRLIRDAVTLTGNRLTAAVGAIRKSFDLERFDRIYVIGFGKATANMATAMEDILGDRITEGVVAVKYGHTSALKRIRIMEAGHPEPDENGLLAARAILDLAKQADQKTLMITLISGGGSALIPCPIQLPGPATAGSLTLADKQAVTRILLECGADIHEINTVRKHLSGIKGGRLARLMAPATSLSLILSDVVGDDLDVIASGATTPDSSTFEDVRSVLSRYDILEQIPEPARQVLNLGLEKRIPDTPKPGDPAFNTVTNLLVGTNELALTACKMEAEKRGYAVRVMNSRLTGESRDVAVELFTAAAEAARSKQSKDPLCLICGGETTVTIRGNGKGGRNQEMALAFLSCMETDTTHGDHIHFLSAGTDGNDGPTDAAGAFADAEALNRSHRKKLSIQAFLDHNDAYHFFDATDGLLKTGPTNTNVCDIQVVIVG